MLHRFRRRKRSVLLFSALIVLLGLSAPPAGGAASPAAGGFTATPNAIEVSLPLGQIATRAVTISNNSDKPLTPVLYEAYLDPALDLPRPALAPDSRAAALPQQADRIDAQLLSALAAAPDRRADFVLYLRDQADLRAAYQIRDWAARGRYVYQTLSEHAARSQRGLREELAARGLRFQPLWIVNAVLVHGSEADARAVAARDDVALVRANHVTALEPEREGGPVPSELCSPGQPDNPVCWNVRAIGADRVWRDFGVAGQGILVANIDTGVDYTHPALAAQYRGYLGPGRYEHSYSWFSTRGGDQAPSDTVGHGTHTMGTIVAAGDGTAEQPAVGVAPRARWIAARACSASACTEADLIAAAQWLLAPTDLVGSNPRPDLRPLIVNNSWAGPGGNSFYTGYTAAWRAAGMFPVFSAGNGGAACGTIASAADYANVVAVGATTIDDTIASFSARGPAEDGRRKPDFAAPGQLILSTVPGGAAYAPLQGTSMAAPHVSGLIALLWSANPALIGDYDATYAILRDTARGISDTQCGDAVGAPNNVYGYGRIDAYAAVARARVDVPWLRAGGTNQLIAASGSATVTVTLDAAKVPGPGVYRARLQIFGADLTQPPATIGLTMTVTPAPQQATLTGRVVSAATGGPVSATVGVEGGLGAPTDSTGAYTLTLALGSYQLVAAAPSFLPASLPITLDADQRAPDIVLQPDLARVAAATSALSASLELGQRPTFVIPIGNTGTQPLYYHARVLPDTFAVARSDEAGGPTYRWIDLPADAPTITLADNGYSEGISLGAGFRFYGYTFANAIVTSNGALSFGAPSGWDGGLDPACFPDSSIYEIAPFRADLDPSRGGKVRYDAVVGGQLFVVSYEDVPLHAGPADKTYTFQVLLYSDGRIVFQYQKLAALPAQLAVGVQHSTADYQELGCGVGAAVHDRLAIELRPQASGDTWIRLDRSDGAVPPSGQHNIAATLNWSRPQGAEFRGRIEIASNDPFRPRLVVPVRATMRPAAHEFVMPIIDVSYR